MADKAISRGWSWLAAALPLLVIAAVAGGYAWYDQSSIGGTADDPDASGPDASAVPRVVQPGRDYYLYISTLELYPEQPDGDPWDRIDNSAPDIQYSLDWQGQEIFRSPQRDNGLIATWDGISVDVRKAVMEGRLEPSAALNHAAVVRVPEGDGDASGELVIHVWDEDVIGLGRDDAGEVRVKLGELFEGDNTIWLEPGRYNGIRRIILRASPTDQPAKNLIEALSPS